MFSPNPEYPSEFFREIDEDEVIRIGKPITPLRHLQGSETLAITYPFQFKLNNQPVGGKVTFGFETFTIIDHAPSVYPFGDYGYKFSIEDYNLETRRLKLLQPVKRYNSLGKNNREWRTIQIKLINEDSNEKIDNPFNQLEAIIDFGNLAKIHTLGGKISYELPPIGATINLFYPAEAGPLACNSNYTYWPYNEYKRTPPKHVGPGHILELSGVPADLVRQITFTFIPTGDSKGVNTTPLS